MGSLLDISLILLLSIKVALYMDTPKRNNQEIKVYILKVLSLFSVHIMIRDNIPIDADPKIKAVLRPSL